MLLIVVLFLSVVNFVIYHKIFSVIYFDLGNGLLKEIIGCFLCAIFEAAIFMMVGPYVLVVLGIVLAIILIVKYINKKKNETVSTNKVDNLHNVKTNDSDKNYAQSVYGTENGLGDYKVVSDKTSQYSGGKNTSNSKTFQEKEGMTWKNETGNFTGKVDTVYNQQENIKQSSKQDTRIFCPYCGEKILRTAKFCNFCGQTNSYGK